MRGYPKKQQEEGAGRRQDKELDSTLRRIGRNSLSAVYRRSGLGFTKYLYRYDGHAWFSTPYISYSEFTNRIAIILTSGAAFGTGLGQLITELIQYVT